MNRTSRILAVLALLLAPGPVLGQEGVIRLQLGCGGGSATGERHCQELALRAQAARAAQGLLASGGGELPGTAATLGFRIGSVPRISVGLRGMVAGVSFSGSLDGSAGDPLPGPRAADDGFTGSAIHLNAGVGIFDGFSPIPTVGGVLAVDAVGAASFVSLPEERGFDGGRSHYGVGLRLGLVRESFTLPGVTVSATRRWAGDTDVAGPYGSASYDLTLTSYRATVGKDLLGVGLIAGAGVDRYAGPVSIDPSETPDPEGQPAGTGPAREKFSDRRTLFFGGGSLNYLVAQLSIEGGWARGMDAPEGRPDLGFDPEDGSWFGSLAIRLIY